MDNVIVAALAVRLTAVKFTIRQTFPDATAPKMSFGDDARALDTALTPVTDVDVSMFGLAIMFS
tara:strand:- start:727 stop:918 length:192 start_codon:yes stop_codon:yes gene_type:complete